MALFYGIDFATRAELIASGLEIEEIRRSIGADSLGYVSLEGLIESTQIDEKSYVLPVLLALIQFASLQICLKENAP